MSDTIAKNIRHYRKQKNMSQGALAKKSGLSLMSIRRYETEGEENREPTVQVLERIATALDVEISQLYQNNIVIKVPKLTPERISELEQEEKELNYLNTIAAHFDGETFSDEEIREIENFIEFVKNRKKS